MTLYDAFVDELDKIAGPFSLGKGKALLKPSQVMGPKAVPVGGKPVMGMKPKTAMDKTAISLKGVGKALLPKMSGGLPLPGIVPTNVLGKKVMGTISGKLGAQPMPKTAMDKEALLGRIMGRRAQQAKSRPQMKPKPIPTTKKMKATPIPTTGELKKKLMRV